MNQSTFKNQHSIPKSYLESWCDPECPPGHMPYVWIFEKENRVGKNKAPKKILRETNMYTQINDKGDRDLTIEKLFSEYERLFQKIRREKFENRLPLNDQEHENVTMFTSILSARTRSHLDHMANQWKRPLEMGEQLREQMKIATKEEKEKISSIGLVSNNEKQDSLTLEQVRDMVENPVGTVMLSNIDILAPRFLKMDYAILEAQNEKCFITNDAPVAWTDPKLNDRPPMYRVLGLAYKTIEITLPISPKQCLLLNWQGVTDYIQIPDYLVDRLNRTNRFGAFKYFIGNKNQTEEYWFQNEG